MSRYHPLFCQIQWLCLILISSLNLQPIVGSFFLPFKTCLPDITHFLIYPTSEGWQPPRGPFLLMPLSLSSCSHLPCDSRISHSAFPSSLEFICKVPSHYHLSLGWFNWILSLNSHLSPKSFYHSIAFQRHIRPDAGTRSHTLPEQLHPCTWKTRENLWAIKTQCCQTTTTHQKANKNPVMAWFQIMDSI